MKPTVGRIVHYTDPHFPTRHTPARIVRVLSESRVNLSVGGVFRPRVRFDKFAVHPFSWHWPEEN